MPLTIECQNTRSPVTPSSILAGQLRTRMRDAPRAPCVVRPEVSVRARCRAPNGICSEGPPAGENSRGARRKLLRNPDLPPQQIQCTVRTLNRGRKMCLTHTISSCCKCLPCCPEQVFVQDIDDYHRLPPMDTLVDLSDAQLERELPDLLTRRLRGSGGRAQQVASTSGRNASSCCVPSPAIRWIFEKFLVQV